MAPKKSSSKKNTTRAIPIGKQLTQKSITQTTKKLKFSGIAKPAGNLRSGGAGPGINSRSSASGSTDKFRSVANDTATQQKTLEKVEMKVVYVRLNTHALAFSMGFLGLLSMFAVSVYPEVSFSLFGKAWGESLRTLLLDTYPYYNHLSWQGVALGLLYGFLEGFVLGALLGFLYNSLAENK